MFGRPLLLLALFLSPYLMFAMNEENPIKWQRILKKTPEAFFEAVKRDNTSRVCLLLKAGINPDMVDQSPAGRSAIHYADSKEMVDLLLNFGADIDAQDQDGMTALHLRVYYFDDELANHLLWKGANKHIRNHFGHGVLKYSTDEIDKILKAALTIDGDCSCHHCRPDKVTAKTRNALWRNHR